MCVCGGAAVVQVRGDGTRTGLVARGAGRGEGTDWAAEGGGDVRVGPGVGLSRLQKMPAGGRGQLEVKSGVRLASLGLRCQGWGWAPESGGRGQRGQVARVWEPWAPVCKEGDRRQPPGERADGGQRPGAEPWSPQTSGVGTRRASKGDHERWPALGGAGGDPRSERADATVWQLRDIPWVPRKWRSPVARQVWGPQVGQR